MFRTVRKRLLCPVCGDRRDPLFGRLTERRVLGELRGELDGHRASVSRTVSAAGVAASASNILGIVGDFDAIRWGIQKQIGLELIQYGDPDGGGDLKRKNQVAFRAEVVYGWGIADLNAFSLIKPAA